MGSDSQIHSKALGTRWDPSQTSLHLSEAYVDSVRLNRGHESEAPWQLLGAEVKGQRRNVGWEGLEGRSGRMTGVLSWPAFFEACVNLPSLLKGVAPGGKLPKALDCGF